MIFTDYLSIRLGKTTTNTTWKLSRPTIRNITGDSEVCCRHLLVRQVYLDGVDCRRHYLKKRYPDISSAHHR